MTSWSFFTQNSNEANRDDTPPTSQMPKHALLTRQDEEPVQLAPPDEPAPALASNPGAWPSAAPPWPEPTATGESEDIFRAPVPVEPSDDSGQSTEPEPTEPVLEEVFDQFEDSAAHIGCNLRLDFAENRSSHLFCRDHSVWVSNPAELSASPQSTSGNQPESDVAMQVAVSTPQSPPFEAYPEQPGWLWDTVNLRWVEDPAGIEPLVRVQPDVAPTVVGSEPAEDDNDQELRPSDKPARSRNLWYRSLSAVTGDRVSKLTHKEERAVIRHDIDAYPFPYTMTGIIWSYRGGIGKTWITTALSNILARELDSYLTMVAAIDINPDLGVLALRQGVANDPRVHMTLGKAANIIETLASLKAIECTFPVSKHRVLVVPSDFDPHLDKANEDQAAADRRREESLARVHRRLMLSASHIFADGGTTSDHGLTRMGFNLADYTISLTELDEEGPYQLKAAIDVLQNHEVTRDLVSRTIILVNKYEPRQQAQLMELHEIYDGRVAAIVTVPRSQILGERTVFDPDRLWREEPVTYNSIFAIAPVMYRLLNAAGPRNPEPLYYTGE